MEDPRAPLWSPMAFAYRATLWLVGAVAAVTVVTTGAELLGLVEPGAWTRSESAVHSALGLVFGVLLLGFVGTALRHAWLRLDAQALRSLRFGVLCGTRTVPLAAIRRFGDGVERGGRVRKRVLLLELDDGTRRIVNLSMYDRGDEVPARLAAHLGRPADPVEVPWRGIDFADGPPR